MSDRLRHVLLLSDVHGNETALRAVIEDAPDVDAVVHAGDLVGYGPSPNACIDLLREHDAHAVRGNHDEALFGGPAYEAGDEHAQATVSDANRAWLGECPETLSVFDGRVRVAHGHPDERFRYTYPADFHAGLLDGAEVLVLGHTHKQAARTFDAGTVVNPGSVGQPRDGDPRAAYAVLDIATGEVDPRRVAYDVDRVVERTAGTPVPEQTARRLAEGR